MAQGVLLRDASTFDENRFTGFPSAPVPNPNFLHANVRLTGVGYRVGGEARAITLVSPKHFVYARHFSLGTTTPLRFIAPDGTIIERFIAQNHNILNNAGQATDLRLGELAIPIPEDSGVIRQPYLNNPGPFNEGTFYNIPPNNQLIIIGRDAQGGSEITGKEVLLGSDTSLNGIDNWPGGSGFNAMRVFIYDYLVSTGANTDARFEVGDSGGPTLVNVGGEGAVVGIHSFFQTASAGGSPALFRGNDTFVAHPPYVTQMNTIMEADGYHMSEAHPDSTTLTLTITPPSGSIRAFHPAVFDYSIENTSSSADANNLVVQHPIATGSIASTTGSGWIETSQSTLFDARKGGLDPSNLTTFSSEIGFSTPGTFSIPITLKYDEGVDITETITITIVDSFLSYVAPTTTQTVDADDDDDSISNLAEYAFGGDISTNELVQSGTSTPLLPIASEPDTTGTVQYTFLRRTDAAARALTYTVQESSSLSATDWQDISLTGEVATDLGNGFESVATTFTPGSTEHFYRLKIDLDE